MIYWILHKRLTESDLHNRVEGSPKFFYDKLQNFCFVDIVDYSFYAKLENRLLNINIERDYLNYGIEPKKYIVIDGNHSLKEFLMETSIDDIFVFQSLDDIRTKEFLKKINTLNRVSVLLNHWKPTFSYQVPMKRNFNFIKAILVRNKKLLLLRLLFRFYMLLNKKQKKLTYSFSGCEKLTELLNNRDISVKNIIPIHTVSYDEYLYSCKEIDAPLIKEPYFVFIDQALTVHVDNKSVKKNDTILYRNEILQSLRKISSDNGNIKIVIAEHPRCQFDKDFWGTYQRFSRKTPELIKYSNGVIGHFSTAIELAKIFNKRLILLNSSSSYFFSFSNRVNSIAKMLEADIVDMRIGEMIEKSKAKNSNTFLTDYLTLLPDSKVENNELFMQFFARFDKKNLCWETACCVPKYQFFEKSDDQKIAGTKAPSDAELFAEQMGFKPLYFFHWGERDFFHRLTGQLRRLFEYIFVFFRIRRKSILFLQFPYVRGGFLGRCMFFKFVRIFKKIKVITLVHDLNELRYENSDKEIKLLDFAISCSDFMIAHNENMCDYLAAVRGVSPKKLVSLDLFDYYVSEKSADRGSSFEKSISIAGNLDANKSAYLRALPNLGLPVYLYGKNYNNKIDNKNIVYKGCFEPECITNELCHGFGLVWDGISADTCDGLYGKYLKYNNPHKLSMYLTAGLPVIVWKQSALCELVVRNKLGIAVSSLYEAVEKIRATSESEYLEMHENCLKLSAKLRSGYFLKKALRNCLEKLVADSIH